MFGRISAAAHEARSRLAALDKSQAVIEFDLDGRVLSANQNFLAVIGYTRDEIEGKHHSMFVLPDEREHAAYAAFWADLNRGEYKAGQFKRIGKAGNEVWIAASYNPILDLNGRPCKIVKYATDVTAQATLLSNLSVAMREIEAAVERSGSQAALASGAAGETSRNVQTMAASAEQLTMSIREIASMMAQSNGATQAAREQTASAEQATQRLSATSSSMGGIVDLIRSISGQINLLALNATIESARAGDAGKGFAVVAGEVKSLAQQARGATDRIAEEIARLQVVSTEVTGALGEIERSIDSISQYVSGTSSAVEEQSAVTQDIASRMHSTAFEVSAINDNVTGISTAVGEVARAVADTKKAVQVMGR